MKKKISIVKRLVCATTALVMSLAVFSGCTKKDEKNNDSSKAAGNNSVTTGEQDNDNSTSAEQVKAEYTNVYTQEDLVFSDQKVGGIRHICTSGKDALWVNYYNQDDFTDKISKVGFDGKELAKLSFDGIDDNANIQKNDSAYIMSMGETSDGGLYQVISYNVSASGIKQEELDWEDDKQLDEYYKDCKLVYYFARFDKDGKFVSGKEMESQKVEREGGNSSSIESVVILGEKYIVFKTSYDDESGEESHSYYTYDEESGAGESKNLEGNIGWISNMAALDDKTIIVSYQSSDDYQSKVAKLDIESGKLGDPKDIKSSASDYADNNIFVGTNGKLYSYNQNGVYSVDYDAGKKTEVVNWRNSSVSENSINTGTGMIALENGDFIAVLNSEEGDSASLVRLSRVSDEDLKNIETITLGVYYTGTEVSKQVAEFNKTQDKYKIIVKDYSQYVSEDDEDASAAYNQYKNDLTTGNAPDIVSLEFLGSKVQDLQSKDAFIDLNTMFEKDSDIKKDDFLENVFSAYEYDGKLCGVCTNWQVMTWAGDKEVFKDYKDGWTIDEFIDFYKNMDSGKTFFNTGNLDRETIFDFIVNVNLGSFIDFKNSTCSFDNEDFIKLLDFIKDLPNDSIAAETGEDTTNWTDEDYQNYYENQNWDEDKWRNQESACRNGKAYIYQASIYDMTNFQEYNKGYFKNGVKFVGLPKVNGSPSSVIYASGAYAISSKTQYPDQCWEFLKTALSDESQNNIDFSLPVKKSALEKKAEEAMKPASYKDENGKEVTEDRTFYLSGEDKEITIGQPTKEEMNEFVAWLESQNGIMTYDMDIMDIINEELSALYSGDKDAQQTAKAIQSRMSIYLSEKS